MQRIASLIAIILFVSSAVVLAVPAKKTLEFDKSPMGKVIFDGTLHKDAGNKCKDCHNNEMFPKMKQGTVTITMDDSVGRDHLGIEQRVAGHMAVESPAIPVRPVHHRRDAEPIRLSFHRKHRSIRALDRVTVSQCSLMVPPVSGCFRFECDPSVTRIG